VYLFYGDESGHTGGPQEPGQPVLVVAGILVNTHVAGKTWREFRALLDELSAIAGVELRELKAQALFRGRREWAPVHHEQRAEARNRVLGWLAERGHKVVASGIVYGRMGEATAVCPALDGVRPRVVATVHTALAIQKAHFATTAAAQRRNASLLFYDHQGDDQSQVARAIANPPEWALEFVGDRVRDGELSAIVDTAYFVDSEQAPLIQLADFVAYMIQRKATLDEGVAESFAGEAAVIDDLFGQLQPLLLERSHRLPRQPDTATREAFRLLSPACLNLPA
jgi:hypothetical protein